MPVWRSASQSAGIASTMRLKSCFREMVQIAGSSIAFDLTVPLVGIEFRIPGTEALKLFR